MSAPRFEPRKRVSLDGRAWWCIWDNACDRWSTKIYHGKYKTRKAAQFAIDYNGRFYGEVTA